LRVLFIITALFIPCFLKITMFLLWFLIKFKR
jgi:hypothetical protein